MAEQLLDGADVVTTFEQRGREAVAQRMTTCAFDEPRLARGPLDSALDGTPTEVVPPHRAAARISGTCRGREDVLPGPLAIGAAKFARERMGQKDRPETLREIGQMESARVRELVAQRGDQPRGQDRDPVATSFAVADHHFATL